MALFSKSLTEAQKELAEVQTSLQAVTAERDAFNTQIEVLTGERDAAKAAALGFETKIGEASARITELETAKLNAESALATYKADFETKVEQKAGARVIELAAAAGLETPIAQTGNDNPDVAPKPGEGLSGLAKTRALLAEKHKSAK